MKQVVQHLRTGRIEVAEAPAPAPRAGHLVIQTAATLISPGTERMLVQFGRSGLLGKARAQPEKVRQVVAKLRTDGLRPTLEAVASRLEEPMPLGYCNVGRVVAVGSGVTGFAESMRVVSNGPHAEVVAVPANLAARIPDEVDDESASFTVLGAIALNGVRLLEPTLGESFGVVGLGVLGLLAVQLLRAHGCRVVAVDLDPARCELARALGAETVCVAATDDPVQASRAATDGVGLDGVLIAATAESDEIVHQAAEMCRRRGRLVLVGVVGLGLRRADFYEKELSFRVACSYGPGRYDAAYETQGRDYPLAHVRWTAARNFEAVLDALARDRIDVRPLISRRLPIAEAGAAYEAVLGDRSALGIVMTYPQDPAALGRVQRVTASASAPSRAARLEAAQGAHRSPVVGVIGAGQFARQVLLPAIRATGTRIAAVASAGSVSSLHAARTFGADEATTDVAHLLASAEIDTVFIATRHDSHAALATAALAAGKHVFVEKPLAIDEAGLAEVARARAAARDRRLLVGFNRRFAPHALQVSSLLAGRADPIAISITVNAGALPGEHWTKDAAIGGGRIVGEACHFIDLASFLVGAAPRTVHAMPLGGSASTADATSISLGFDDGSIATVHYWTNGPRAYPKERIEVFSSGRAIVIDNWRALRAFGWPGAPRMWRRQDKGHRAEIAGFLAGIAAGDAPLVPFEELVATTRAALACVRSAREGAVVELAHEALEEAGPAIETPHAAEPIAAGARTA
ncbi:MAG: zinc-binding dehydrogenase [Deltaproteobacteria bacterium]|nr:zinc-binding dehydrogenase [Deltaproteobacteria bacterium]